MAMSTKLFSFEALSDIDHGSVALAVNKAIRDAFLDMADRPEVKQARKVTLSIELTPVMRDGQFYQSLCKCDVDGRHPKRGIEIRMNAEADGLAYNPGAYENPNQKTIPMEDN